MCGLVPESDDPNTAHQLYCFCFWAAQKCVAVYRPPEGYSNAEKQFLAKMFGGDPYWLCARHFQRPGLCAPGSCRFGPASVFLGRLRKTLVMPRCTHAPFKRLPTPTCYTVRQN
ncbi:hypothetical protein MRX96_047273 [Rhipicephalus microplus]